MSGRLALVGLVSVELIVGGAAGHLTGTVLLLTVVALAWACAGFPAVAVVCLAVLALASSSIPECKEAALDLRWVALTLLAAWPAVSGRRPALLVPKAFAGAVVTLILLGAASAAWSFDPVLTLSRAAAFTLLLWVALVVFPVHVQTTHERRALARWLAALCVTGAVAALAVGALSPTIGRPYGPLHGWLENSNTLGLWCAFLAPTLLMIRSRRLLLAGAVPVAAAIGLTESRSALLVVACTAFLLAPISMRRRAGAVAAAVAILLLLVVSPAHQLLEGTTLGKFRGGGDLVQNLTGARNEAWSETLDLVPDVLLEGYGFGTGDRVFEREGVVDRFVNFQGSNPNSAYLNVLLEQGLWGLAALLAAFVIAARSLLRGGGAARDRSVFAAMAIGVAVAGAVESLFTSAGSPFTILLWAPLGVALSRSPSSQPASRPRILVHAASLSETPNGARTVLTELLAELPAAWPEADLVMTAQGSGEARSIEGITMAPLRGARPGVLRLFDDYGRLPSLARRTRADLVIAPNESVASRIDVPLVVVAQNLVYHCRLIRPQLTGTLRSRLRSKVQFGFYRRQMPRAYERADAVVAVSRTTLGALTSTAGLRTECAHVVHEGADGIPVLPRRPDEHGPRRLLVVGTSAPYKRTEVAIAALAELNRAGDDRGYELRLVGGEWPGHGALLDRLATRHAVGDRYSRTGVATPDELAALYATAHALIALSGCESFGLPVAEAMRAGLPVVAADERWSREVAEPSAILVDGEDGCSVAAGIRRLEDPAERAARVAAGRDVAADLTWGATAQGIARVARGVLGSPEPASPEPRPAAGVRTRMPA